MYRDGTPIPAASMAVAKTGGSTSRPGPKNTCRPTCAALNHRIDQQHRGSRQPDRHGASSPCLGHGPKSGKPQPHESLDAVPRWQQWPHLDGESGSIAPFDRRSTRNVDRVLVGVLTQLGIQCPDLFRHDLRDLFGMALDLQRMQRGIDEPLGCAPAPILFSRGRCEDRPGHCGILAGLPTRGPSGINEDVGRLQRLDIGQGGGRRFYPRHNLTHFLIRERSSAATMPSDRCRTMASSNKSRSSMDKRGTNR